MVSDELRAHAELIRQLSRDTGPLSQSSAYSSLNNREWHNRRGEPSYERRSLHKELISEALQGADTGYKAVMLSGPPGAGKSRARDAFLAEHSNEKFASLDADEFKIALLRAVGNQDEFDKHFKAPEIRELEAQGHQFFPLEFASLVHTESSRLLNRAIRTAQDAGLNIVIDGVGANLKAGMNRLEKLSNAGYSVDLINVECSRETSRESILHRWGTERDKALSSPQAIDLSTLGGRWVPSTVLDPVFPNQDGPSAPEEVAAHLAAHSSAVRSYQLWRRDSPTSTPTLERDQIRLNPGKPLIERADAQAAQVAFGARPRAHIHTQRPNTVRER